MRTVVVDSVESSLETTASFSSSLGGGLGVTKQVCL